MLCGDGRADECIFFAARQKHNRTERKAYRSMKRFFFVSTTFSIQPDLTDPWNLVCANEHAFTLNKSSEL